MSRSLKVTQSTDFSEFLSSANATQIINVSITKADVKTLCCANTLIQCKSINDITKNEIYFYKKHNHDNGKHIKNIGYFWVDNNNIINYIEFSNTGISFMEFDTAYGIFYRELNDPIAAVTCAAQVCNI